MQTHADSIFPSHNSQSYRPDSPELRPTSERYELVGYAGDSHEGQESQSPDYTPGSPESPELRPTSERYELVGYTGDSHKGQEGQSPDYTPGSPESPELRPTSERYELVEHAGDSHEGQEGQSPDYTPGSPENTLSSQQLDKGKERAIQEDSSDEYQQDNADYMLAQQLGDNFGYYDSSDPVDDAPESSTRGQTRGDERIARGLARENSEKKKKALTELERLTKLVEALCECKEDISEQMKIVKK